MQTEEIGNAAIRFKPGFTELFVKCKKSTKARVFTVYQEIFAKMSLGKVKTKKFSKSSLLTILQDFFFKSDCLENEEILGSSLSRYSLNRGFTLVLRERKIKIACTNLLGITKNS